MTFDEWFVELGPDNNFFPGDSEELFRWCLHYYNKGALDALNQLNFEAEND